MREITASGRSIEEALNQGLQSLQISKEEAIVTVLDEGKKGFFGIFGTKPAVVKIEKKISPLEYVERYLETILNGFDVEAKWEVEEQGKNIVIRLNGKGSSHLIGKRGATLNAIQYLLQLNFNRYSKQYRTIIVDTENYREKRKETLEALAKKLSKTVLRTRKPITLEPMPSFERKIIHAIVTQFEDLQTKSVGLEPNRHIVIEYKKL